MSSWFEKKGKRTILQLTKVGTNSNLYREQTVSTAVLKAGYGQKLFFLCTRYIFDEDWRSESLKAQFSLDHVIRAPLPLRQ